MKIKTLLPFIRTKFAYIQPWLADATLLFARLTIGWSFFLTGKGKLANLERTTGFFESLGIPAPAFHAAFVGGVEMIGGLLLLAGLMIVAYLTAHREDAFQSLGSMVDETPYAYLIVCMFVLAFGPGRIALDRLLFRKGCSGKACEQGNRK
jgi:putative oxidoreductase